jgi:hypothetical protein
MEQASPPGREGNQRVADLDAALAGRRAHVAPNAPVEELQDRLQLQRRGLDVAEHVAGELHAGLGGRDAVQPEKSSPSREGEASGEILRPVDAVGLYEDVLAGTADRSCLAEALPDPPGVTGESEGDLPAGRVLPGGVVAIRAA